MSPCSISFIVVSMAATVLPLLVGVLVSSACKSLTSPLDVGRRYSGAPIVRALPSSTEGQG